MKYLSRISLVVLLFNFFNCHSLPYEVNKEYSGSKIVTGEFPKSVLQLDPDMKSWYAMNYAGYTVDTTLLSSIDSLFGGCHAVIIMGTWCGDSKHQIPHLIKIFDEAKIDSTQYEIHGVDRTMKSPDNYGEKYAVKFVPTIVFTKEGKEIGRIVEMPTETLEKEIVKILEKH